ncbi:hypothetical protein H310_15179 [Aphanomyces invadans]|uniref:Uncharacterized protein n=1 Tax=Aphanomyces invadans TaxID=157072 RepID=A0A024T8P8_9STRA|nr:hypothetical protein H310_15179 [Aphanomyces invadans]ETV89981.1 hypothetical protein H310_15179 [Aphanomyces invadans]|eukprot:XP_008881387.1 hypothetical protein H310_15179 [Aphanomyces invadans]
MQKMMTKSLLRLLPVTSYTPPAIQPPLTKLKSPKGFTPFVHHSYTVRGVVYPEGPAHEDKLKKTKQCELWLDDEENWVLATITRIFSTSVHETNEMFKHYHVQRRDTPTAPPIEDTAEFLHQVQQIVSGSKPTAFVKPAAPDYGGWSTVSKTQIQIERDNDFLMNESLHADNAMGAFNPWGGRYKGIALDGADPPREDSKDDMAVAPVAFQIKKGGRKHQGKHVDVSLSRAKTWQLDSFTTSKSSYLLR